MSTTNEKVIVNCISTLNNLGNTCYLNVIIQLLNNISELRHYSFNSNLLKKIKLKENEESNLTLEFFKLLKMMNIRTKVIDPSCFKNTLDNTNEMYQGFEQHDCCEFLMYLIDNIHVTFSHKVKITYSGNPQNLRDRLTIKSIKSWNDSFKNEYSDIVPLLYGQNKITMTNKKNINHYMFEPYNVLSLSISNCKSLYDCFNKINNEETLTDHKEYNSKYEHLWRLPKYLFIQLKRFKGTKKITNLINYPIDDLDLSDYCDSYDKDKSNYNLIGVANHHGLINFGHYTCFIKDEGSWYLFNDDKIELVNDIEQIISKDAYLLLYEKII
jgi:ubiquitin C-terminal hydrolase